MAATLASLQIPTTLSSNKSSQSQSQCLIIPSPSPSIKINLSNHPLKSASLSLSALTLPFLLNPQATLPTSSFHFICLSFFDSTTKMHLLLVVNLGSWRGDHWPWFIQLSWVVCSLIRSTLGIWVGNGGGTIQDEINDLKKQEKPLAVTPDGTPVEPTTPSPVQAKIQQLSEERKVLIKGQYREKHFNAGSILLAFGVFESIGGGVNTYLRTGKLFPGPHLYAGAAITVLWAAAAALVPPMQKGSETARNLHIALNVFNVLLFIWQIPTGWDIVLKVFEFTKWP
ncbi:LOW QUALITY PROTEIN: hypothetical protein OSB04_010644 [Centaurea solstitialis]|uniref:Uncharacterized protein n=1 Tax=Centaurea solstitialis TaxID=347529 RepID=A0AA38TJQ5_9ASTR|nr:LOW QUALITY PROTEIN: hypothetical protein OSB04_010644 [Centaurea solstitialis]